MVLGYYFGNVIELIIFYFKWKGEKYVCDVKCVKSA